MTGWQHFNCLEAWWVAVQNATIYHEYGLPAIRDTLHSRIHDICIVQYSYFYQDQMVDMS